MTNIAFLSLKHSISHPPETQKHDQTANKIDDLKEVSLQFISQIANQLNIISQQNTSQEEKKSTKKQHR